MAVMTIRDSGVGIRAGDLAHIFDIFFQGEVPANVHQGGLGIGLPVVKNLLNCVARRSKLIVRARAQVRSS